MSLWPDYGRVQFTWGGDAAMLRVGIVGLGFMGRAHLANYLRLESEGVGVKLVSVCDIDEAKTQRAARWQYQRRIRPL